jgi:choline dehydrogenase-like flavoprotein
MKFLRAMHEGARNAGRRLFWWAVTIVGGSALAMLWPEITRRIGK